MSEADSIVISQEEAVISSRNPDSESANIKTRTKLDEVVEAGLNIFGGRVINN